jgi:hypothetical protein
MGGSATVDVDCRRRNPITTISSANNQPCKTFHDVSFATIYRKRCTACVQTQSTRVYETKTCLTYLAVSSTRVSQVTNPLFLSLKIRSSKSDILVSKSSVTPHVLVPVHMAIPETAIVSSET